MRKQLEKGRNVKGRRCRMILTDTPQGEKGDPISLALNVDRRGTSNGSAGGEDCTYQTMSNLQRRLLEIRLLPTSLMAQQQG
jgi:hypothetical protein